MSISEQFAVQWALEQTFCFWVFGVLAVLWVPGMWIAYKRDQREP